MIFKACDICENRSKEVIETLTIYHGTYRDPVEGNKDASYNFDICIDCYLKVLKEALDTIFPCRYVPASRKFDAPLAGASKDHSAMKLDEYNDLMWFIIKSLQNEYKCKKGRSKKQNSL